MIDWVKDITLMVSQAAEIIAAVLIGISLIRTLVIYFISAVKRDNAFHREEDIRLRFGSSVAVSLELLLGADVLATAVAPSWNDIGQLAAIAAIRTLLNYFLGKELAQVPAKDHKNLQP